MTKRDVKEVAHEVARTLIRMADFRSVWVEKPATEAGQKYWKEAMAEYDNAHEIMSKLPLEEQSEINKNLYHLNRAAIAGDHKEAARAYDSAKEAGIFG